jgi:ABC-type multidrug transport system fused ATPase/permease subunit
MDNKLKIPLSIVLGGYISSIGFCLIWYWINGYKLLNPMRHVGTYALDNAIVIFAITVIYFFTLLLIWSNRSLQTFWTTFFLVSIITLLTSFLIPSSYYASYRIARAIGKTRIEKTRENAQTEQNRIKEIEANLNDVIKKNNASENLIVGLKTTLKSVREENVKLKEQLNEKIRKIQSLEDEQKTKETIASQAKSNKNFPMIKTNSKMLNTESDTKNQEIIFKVQIISSDTRLAKNSPKFKKIKGVWEYKDGDLYKYTVGNQKDLKSAYALQSELRKKGFSGAFVVAFKNGKRIPIRKAKD